VKSVYALISVVSVIAACAQPAPQVDVAAEEAAVRAVSDSITAAEIARDFDKALSFYANDAVVQPPDAPPVVGKDAMRGLYQAFFTPEITAFSSQTSSVQVSASGDMAWITGVNSVTVTLPAGAQTLPGKFLAVARKIDGAWKVVALSFSNDAPVSAPPTTTTKME
jgi:uncharacterized protein (TIGR02246 family)